MSFVDVDPSIFAFPADLTPKQIGARIVVLAGWSKFSAEHRWVSLCLSTMINRQLRESGYLPAHEPVAKALRKSGVQAFSPGDIIRIIYSILDNALPRAHCCITDELHSDFVSDPKQPWHAPKSLDTLTEQSLVIGHIERHLHGDERLRVLLSFLETDQLKFKALLEIVEPSDLPGLPAKDLPKHIHDQVTVVRSIEEFLATLSAEQIWANATDAIDIKVAILLKCREKLLSTQNYKGLNNIPLFYVGSDFYESLCGRECDRDQKYAAQTLDACASAVLSFETIEIKPFEKNPRKADGAEPLRAHINKSGAAMRLMMWKRPAIRGYSALEFSNVGRKHEEEICYSDPADAV